MSVQAAVALLNKNAPAPQLSIKPSVSSPPGKLTTWRSSNGSSSATTKYQSTSSSSNEVKRVNKAPGGGSIASILSKFNPEQSNCGGHKPVSNRGNRAQSLSSASSASDIRTRVERTRSSTGQVRTAVPAKGKVSGSDVTMDELVDMYNNLLEQCRIAQEQVDQLSKDKSKTDKEKTATSSQIRDYEIRIQYLSEKVEQLSKQHSELEEQVSFYRQHYQAGMDTPVSPKFKGMSKVFGRPGTDISTPRHDIVDTSTTAETEDFWNRLLDVYEKGSSVSTAPTTNGDDDCICSESTDNSNKGCRTETSPCGVDEQLLFAKEQIQALEKGAQMLMESQARELAKERLHSRNLTNLIQKQDELISALESKLSQRSVSCVHAECVDQSSGDNVKSEGYGSKDLILLREQIELQQAELEDKRALLARLLDEREELSRQITHMNQHAMPCCFAFQRQQRNSNATLSNSGKRSRSASVRSSIDILTEMAKAGITDGSRHPLSRPPSTTASARSSSQSLLREALGRCTPPPLTAPPREPLPPLPVRNSRTSQRGSSSATSTTLTSTDSWSSFEHDRGTSTTPPTPRTLETNDIVSSTVYRDASQYSCDPAPLRKDPVSTVYRDASQYTCDPAPLRKDPVSIPPSSSTSLISSKAEPPSDIPRSVSTVSVNRRPTIKMSKKGHSSQSGAFWKGWRNRFASR